MLDLACDDFILFLKQELLELGEKIGQVNIGLGEEEISRCVRKMRFTLNALPAHASSPLRWRCTICQVGSA